MEKKREGEREGEREKGEGREREREEGETRRRDKGRDNWSMSVIKSGMCVLPVELVYQSRLVEVVTRPKHDSTIL